MSRDKARDERRERELWRLQAVIAEQQAEAGQAQPADAEAEHVKPVAGMPADIVLTLVGYTKRDATQKPTRAGWDRNGMVVRWHYPDLTLTLRRCGEPLCYRVSGIVERGSDGKTTEVLDTNADGQASTA